MASDGTGEKVPEVVDELPAGGDCSISTQPQLRSGSKMLVTRIEVLQKKRVSVRSGVLADDKAVAFKILVRLVSWKPKTPPCATWILSDSHADPVYLAR